MKNRIFLSPPHLNQEAQTFLEQAISSNFIAPVGPMLDEFEHTLCKYNLSPHCVALNSATSAIHLSLVLLGVQENDFVITQTHTHIGGVNPIVYCGATPVFVDSEAETWNMSPEWLEKAIIDCQQKGNLPKAIIPVHLYGMPAQIEQILHIANRYNIPVIEDAAESLGSTYKGKKTGTFGDLGVFSFNGNKIITTSGGGALVSQDEDLIKKARFLATQAREAAIHYQHSEIGYNYRLSNVLAGIGRGQMEVLPKRIEQRRSVFNQYKTYFEKVNQKGFHIEFQEEGEGMFSNRWLTAILVDPSKNKGITSETIRLELEKDNIESRPLWKPMHMQPVFSDMPFYGNGTSERLFELGLCLPSGSNMSEEDFDRIKAALDLIFVA